MNAENQAVDAIVSTTVTSGMKIAEKSLDGGMALSGKLLKLTGKSMMLMAALIASMIHRSVRSGGSVGIEKLKSIDPNSSSIRLPKDRIKEFDSLAKEYGIPYHIVKDKQNLTNAYSIIFPYAMAESINTILKDHLHLDSLPRKEEQPTHNMADSGLSDAQHHETTNFEVSYSRPQDKSPLLDNRNYAALAAPSLRKQLQEHKRRALPSGMAEKPLLPENRPSIRLMMQEIKAQQLLLPAAESPIAQKDKGFAL